MPIENEDSRERALAALRTLEQQLAPVFERLPEAPESAIQFRVAEDDE